MKLYLTRYPHGCAIVNTLQRVSGAIAIVIVVSIMASVHESKLSQSLSMSGATTSGVHSAFIFTIAIVSIAKNKKGFYK
nr:multidrug efflux MFS transporter [Brevibacillus laterosporus]